MTRLTDSIVNALLSDKDRKWYLRKKTILFLIVVAFMVLIVGLIIARDRDSHRQELQAYAQLNANVSALRNKNRDSEALIALVQFVSTYPKLSDKSQQFWIDTNMSDIYYEFKDYNNAEKWFQLAIANNPNPNYSDYTNLGLIQMQLAQYNQAINSFQQALSIMKAHPDAETPSYTVYIENQIAMAQASIHK